MKPEYSGFSYRQSWVRFPVRVPLERNEETRKKEMKKIKDERFTLRLPDNTRTILQWLAQHYSKSESEMVRVLLERGLRTLLPADLVEFEVPISTQVSRIFEVSQQ